jgi:hypothetical protein
MVELTRHFIKASKLGEGESADRLRMAGEGLLNLIAG